MESLAIWFANTLGKFVSKEIVIFIISMIPILELRGGLVAAFLLEVPMAVAVPVCIIGNIIPIPFILLFIKQIFKWLKKISFFKKFIEKLETRAMNKSDSIKSMNSRTDAFCRHTASGNGRVDRIFDRRAFGDRF